MLKARVVFGLLLMLSAIPALAQGTYFVDYYANNSGPVTGAPDQTIRIINVGTAGTPLTSPVGDVCASFYVFDNAQEMLACCSCRLTPNELASASVGFNLTSNPITTVVPTAGVIKIVAQTAAGTCSETSPITGADATTVAVFGTHLQSTAGATFVTESEKLASPLGAAEAGFLSTACSFAHYLGSGRGTCSCSAPGL